jgi:hypothetical protein
VTHQDGTGSTWECCGAWECVCGLPGADLQGENAELRATIERAVDLIAGGIVDHAVEVTALRIDGAIGTDITEALRGVGWADLDDEARQPLRDLIRRAIAEQP